jgi:hypothetical protein
VGECRERGWTENERKTTKYRESCGKKNKGSRIKIVRGKIRERGGGKGK